MDSHDSARLRIRLREVNVEYSRLVRDRSEERRFVRMSDLRTERRAIMALLFGGAADGRRPLVSRPQRPQVAMLSAAE
jgi:hypothetical protein